MDKVNVFLVGAQKAGTTSLYDWLGQHPSIEAPKQIKDAHFFCEHIEREDSLEEYYSSQKCIKLHSAVNYLYFSDYCSKEIYKYNPQSKIIVCLRNPTDRAISAYKYFVRIHKEEASLDDALQREINGDLKTKEDLADFAYLKHGEYSAQVDSYVRLFGSDRVKVIFFEDLMKVEKRKAVMEDVLAFIGVKKSFDFDFSHLNASNSPKFVLLDKLIAKIRKFNWLKRLVPLTFRRSVIRSISKINISDKPLNIEISDSTKEFIDDYYSDEILRISQRFSKRF